MTQVDEKQLKLEINHILDSGANEIRLLEMIKTFISRRYDENALHKQELKTKLEFYKKLQNKITLVRNKKLNLVNWIDEVNEKIYKLEKELNLILIYCDDCGKEIIDEVFPVFNENYTEEIGSICKKCFAIKLNVDDNDIH